MYSFRDVECGRLSDEDASGDSSRCYRFSGRQVDPSLSLGFGENMRKLKEAHERTVDLCSRLCYQEPEKEAERQDYDDDENNGEFESGTEAGLQEKEQTHSDTSKSSRFSLNSNSELLNKSVGSMQNILAKNAKDHVRDFSTADEALDNPRTSKGVQLDPRPHIRCFETSEDDESEYERYKENRATVIHNDTLQSAMARIEDMWGTFAVDDYAPWSSFRQSMNVKRSRSLTKVDAESKKNCVTHSTLKKKLTVLDPPTMLLRDANKTPKKTKAMIELDQQREEGKRLEEIECRKQFRAHAAPGHIRLRLFEEMSRRQEERRQLIRQNGEEILKSMQKPFEFLEREEQKKKEKLKEMGRSVGRQSKRHFRAKPFPAHIFNGTVEDKILEEEEYRRIRMRMRAEELLNSSTVPYSMRVRNRLERSSHWAENVPEEAIFRPRVNQTLPDLDEQYQRFMEQMIKRKEGKKPTTCKPFNLRLAKPTPKKTKISSGSSHDALKLSRQRALNSKAAKVSLSSSLDSIPTHLRAERKKSGGQLSRRQRLREMESTQKEGNDVRWNVLPGDVVYTLSDSDAAVRSGELPKPDGLQLKSRNRTSSSKQIQSADLHNAYEGIDQLAPNNSECLNLTYDLDNSDDDGDVATATENSPNDFWSHPSLVRRSEFWSNPVASAH